MTTSKTIILATAFVGMLTHVALAGDPRCAKMSSPQACNCAMENGGQIKEDFGRQVWRSPHRKSPMFVAYMACVNSKTQAH